MQERRIMRDTRLGKETRSLGLGPQPSRQDETGAASETAVADRDALRAAFADEIEAEFERAREDGQRAGRQEAEAALEKARRQLERDLETAFEKRVEDELAHLRNAAEGLLEGARKLEQARADIQKALEPAVIETSLAAIGKILGREARDGTLVRRVVRQQLKQEGARSQLQIRVARVDYELLTNDDEIALDSALLTPDDRLEAGDCVIEHDQGRVDAGIETQLRELRRTLERVAARTGEVK